MAGGVWQQLQIIGTILIVRTDEQTHHIEQEGFTGRMVREQRVPIHQVQLTLIRMR